MARWLIAGALALLPGCYCGTYATSGCLTPSEIRLTPAEWIADERSWVREEAARVLEDRDVLERVLRDGRERPWVRAAAAEGLGRIGAPEALPALAGVLVEPGVAPEVKIAAIVALCRLRDAGTEPLAAIAPLSGDESLLVAAVAQENLVTRCGGAR